MELNENILELLKTVDDREKAYFQELTENIVKKGIVVGFDTIQKLVKLGYINELTALRVTTQLTAQLLDELGLKIRKLECKYHKDDKRSIKKTDDIMYEYHKLTDTVNDLIYDYSYSNDLPITWED